jgi:hypothetical protein
MIICRRILHYSYFLLGRKILRLKILRLEDSSPRVFFARSILHRIISLEKNPWRRKILRRMILRKENSLPESYRLHSNFFLVRNGQIRAVKFRPKNFGRFFFVLGEISPNQQILRLNNGRNSPEIFEGEPQLRGFA